MNKILKYLFVLFLHGQLSYASQSNLNPDFPIWFRALKESTLISLGNDPKLRKFIEKAQFYGTTMKNFNFGDIITLSKGKLRKINEETFAFQQTNDYEEASSTDNIIALYLVEKIRHHDKNSLRFSLRFTIIPIERENPKNLESLRKRIFILRDIDYPEYFSAPQIPNQISMRSDNFPMSSHNLNYGEFQRRRPVFHHQRNQNRLPIRFPESHEALPSYMHPVRHKNSPVFYQLDHRGAVPDYKKFHEEKDNKNSFYQSSIAVPMYLAVPQMSVLHTIPMIPLPLPVPNNNQRSLSTFSGKNNLIPPRKGIHNENLGISSIRVQKFLLPNDRKLNESSTNESKSPIKYSPKLSENMDQNNDFQPIIPPFQYMRRGVRDRSTTTTKTTSTTPSTTIKEPSSTSTITYIEKPTKTQKKGKTYDILATRPSLTNNNSTTERPVLKWYPKKHRSRITTTTVPPTIPIVETTSPRSLLFRGRNRFMLSNGRKIRNETTTTTLALSSKWKAITSTDLPTTESMETTKLLTNYTMHENESSTTIKPQNNNDFVELVSANVEEVKSNSTNIDIFKATEIDANSTVESTTLSNE